MRLSIDRGSDVWWEACRLELRERWMRKRETVEIAITVVIMISIMVFHAIQNDQHQAVTSYKLYSSQRFRMQAEIVIMKHQGSTLIGCRERHHVTSLAQSGAVPQAALYYTNNGK